MRTRPVTLAPAALLLLTVLPVSAGAQLCKPEIDRPADGASDIPLTPTIEGSVAGGLDPACDLVKIGEVEVEIVENGTPVWTTTVPTDDDLSADRVFETTVPSGELEDGRSYELRVTYVNQGLFGLLENPTATADFTTRAAPGTSGQGSATVGGWVVRFTPMGDHGDAIAGADLHFESQDGDVRRTATTDQKGEFEIELPPGDYDFRITHPEHRTFRWEDRENGSFTLAAGDRRTLELGMETNDVGSVILMGHVVAGRRGGPEGPSIPGAEIRFENPAGTTEHTFESGPNGSFRARFPTGRYEFDVTAPYMRPESSDSALAFPFRGVLDSLTFHLRYRSYDSGLEGRVQDVGITENVAGATLWFTMAGGHFRRTVETDARGWYEIELPTGRYEVRITHPDYQTLTTGRAEQLVDDGIDRKNFFLEPETSGAGTEEVRRDP